MKKLSCGLFALLLFVMLQSCSSKVYYQVYEVKSRDVAVQDNHYVAENADCKITYNLWSEGGDMSFMVYNKTDKDMYLVMPRSFFILNGIANDYYSKTTYGTSVTTTMGLTSDDKVSIGGYITTGYYWYPTVLSRQYGQSAGLSKTKSVTIEEMPLICVPPKSGKLIKGYNISDYIYKDCDDRKFNYPKKESQIIEYSETNSPLSFRNRISYTFDEKSEQVNTIEHSFWINKLQNFSDKGAFTESETEECETKAKISTKVFKMSGANKFYNNYSMPTFNR